MEYCQGKLHAFVRIHRCIVVEVFEVNFHKSSPWGGYNAVEQDFGGGETSTSCGSVTNVLKSVATDCKANSILLCLFWAYSRYQATVGDCLAWGNSRGGNGK